jgi:hypothetical protein
MMLAQPALQRRPAGQSDGSGNLSAIVAADRAFPAAVAELVRPIMHMTSLSKEAVEIRSNSKGLIVADWTIRETRKEDAEDSGWRLQAVLLNESFGQFKNLESEVRYFDSAGKFLGVDEWVSFLDELGRGEDRAVSISLNVPSNTSRAVFCAKGKRTNFFERHAFLLFGVVVLLAAVISFIKK